MVPCRFSVVLRQSFHRMMTWASTGLNSPLKAVDYCSHS